MKVLSEIFRERLISTKMEKDPKVFQEVCSVALIFSLQNREFSAGPEKRWRHQNRRLRRNWQNDNPDQPLQGKSEPQVSRGHVQQVNMFIIKTSVF